MADANQVSELANRLKNLEARDDGNARVIVDLEKENKTLKTQIKNLSTRLDKMQRLEDLRKASVFSARCTPSANLGDDPANSWKPIDKSNNVYKSSVHFNTENCTFAAPVKGDYFFNLGFRQQGSGKIEAMLQFPIPIASQTANSPQLHAHVGVTEAQGQVCNKSVVLSLKAGDQVHGVIRRMSGQATVMWCALHGYLISGEIPG